MPDLSHARDRMVEIQIAGRGVRDRGVLEAMRAVVQFQMIIKKG
jgi:hypothetical protein